MIWFPESSINEDISDAQYFESAPWKDFISNSKLGLIDPNHGGSYGLFERLSKNEKRSKSLQHGTIVHSLLLQANDYGVSDIVRPSGKLGDMVYDVFRLRSRDNPVPIHEAISTVVKLHDYYGKSLTKNRIVSAMRDGLPYYKHLRIYKDNVFVLNSEEVEVVLGCLEGIKANSQAMSLLFPSNILRYNEFSTACGVQIDDKHFMVKAKIDNWTYDVVNNIATLNDLKTTGANIDYFMSGYTEQIPDMNGIISIFHPGSFQKYSYFRQMAMYTKILEMHIIKTYGVKPKIYVNMVVVETKPPYRCQVFDVGHYEDDTFSRNELRFGLNQTEVLLRSLKDNNYVQEIEWINGITNPFV